MRFRETLTKRYNRINKDKVNKINRLIKILDHRKLKNCKMKLSFYSKKSNIENNKE